MITIGYSTRAHNPQLQEYFKKSCGHPKVEIIEKINPNGRSLTEVYNEIINESNTDIVVLCHDDIYFEKNGWGYKLLEHFKKSDFGVLGVAGSTYIPKSGMWWEDRRKMIGIVNHEHEGKKWESKYSESQGNLIKETILVDGLFIAFNKNKIKNFFNEKIKGFHFYDVDFCIQNHINDVKIGVITNIRITHKSIGMTNENWEENRKFFIKEYSNVLPIKKIKKLNEKLKMSFLSLDCEDSFFQNFIKDLKSNGHYVSIVSNFDKKSLNFFKNNHIKTFNLNEPPGFKLGDGVWSFNTEQGKIISEKNKLYKTNEIDYDVLFIKDISIVNHSILLYPTIEKVVLNLNENDVVFSHNSIKSILKKHELGDLDLNKKIFEVVNSKDIDNKKQKIKILSGHSEKGGSTTSFINLTNTLNSKGYDCTFYGPHVWHLDKCQSGNINDVKIESDDIVICHFLKLQERPKAKKVILSLHEKNLFKLSETKQYWDEVVFLHEEHKNYHSNYNGSYSLIPNLKEKLNKKDKSELDMIAGIIGTIDENKQTHVSIKRALNDGCEKVLLFGSISESNYYEKEVKPLLSEKVVHMGHIDKKQSIYDMLGRVYHSSISEVACLIKDECYSTGTKFFGNESTNHQVSDLTNDEIINKWIKVFGL